MNRFHRLLETLLCAVILIPASVWSQKVDVSAHPMIGEEAPPFELVSIKGKTSSLEDWRGKFLVVHFGTSW